MSSNNDPLHWRAITAGMLVAVVGGISVTLFTSWLNENGSNPEDIQPYRILEHEKLVPHYYSLLNTSQYKNAWSLLSKEFRRNAHYGEFSHYVQSYRNMALCAISGNYKNLASKSSTTAVYEVSLAVKAGDTCKESKETYMFTLSKLPDTGAWVIRRVFSANKTLQRNPNTARLFAHGFAIVAQTPLRVGFR